MSVIEDKEEVSAQPSPSGWQPVETAPARPLDKHGYGPTLLLWVEGAVCTGFWDDDFGRFYIENSVHRHPQPTHWMPLPAPPETKP